MEKYTDIHGILPQLSSTYVQQQVEQNNKVYTLELEGYTKFRLILLCAHSALPGECS